MSVLGLSPRKVKDLCFVFIATAYQTIKHKQTCWTNSMEQRLSLEANSFSASKEILRSLWNPDVHYYIHKSPPTVPILSQLNLVHDLHPTSWRSILILSSHLCLVLPSGRLPSGLSTKILTDTSAGIKCVGVKDISAAGFTGSSDSLG
jgi:hypothetical protein